MKIFGVIVAVLAAFFAFGFGVFLPSVSWKQKLIIAVETPSGVVLASSVTKIGKRETGGFLAPSGARGVSSSQKGEAVVVDLGDGKYLFALLKDNKSLASKVFDEEEKAAGQPSTSWPQWAKDIAQSRTQHRVSRKFYPMLVTFANINNPKSVRLVDPNNLAASFGVGYRLKSITLEITDDKVTKGGVESVLGWLETIKGRIKPTDKKYADQLTSEEKLYNIDFIRK